MGKEVSGEKMNIEILYLSEGAKRASGVTVVIDVFRAFSTEAYLYHRQVKEIIAVSEVIQAHTLKKEIPDAILCGERNGIILDGFDFGNSPSAVMKADLTGRTVIHTTSAGTQGLSLVKNAECILTGAFVNAKATAEYIKSMNPEHVSLVCMGWHGNVNTEEDILCAEYLQALLQGKEHSNIDTLLQELKFREGKKFFDPKLQSVFPEADFWCCIRKDQFDFVIQAERVGDIYRMRKVEVHG